ncbi:hypothetical protein [Streptomyces sp. NPDC050982]|uniref:hypothetical protein n=1 Tax=Streptomyces sp. NPDC050982 TaxID=3154746 RepID=UPI00340BFCBE
MVHTSFPPDLIRAQRDWNRIYEALAQRPCHTAVLRRRLRELSSQLAAHPFWETEAGWSSAARLELRRQVRAEEAG